eukprot:6178989-Pleurochrysis_carterae.AAC.1
MYPDLISRCPRSRSFAPLYLPGQRRSAHRSAGHNTAVAILAAAAQPPRAAEHACLGQKQGEGGSSPELARLSAPHLAAAGGMGSVYQKRKDDDDDDDKKPKPNDIGKEIVKNLDNIGKGARAICKCNCLLSLLFSSAPPS